MSQNGVKIAARRLKNRSGQLSTSNLDTIDVGEQIFNEILLNFEASVKVKTIQNADDVVQKWTLRIYVINCYRGCFDGRFSLPKWSPNWSQNAAQAVPKGSCKGLAV